MVVCADEELSGDVALDEVDVADCFLAALVELEVPPVLVEQLV